MKFKSYIVARDYGFAPNPFGKYCTLACCKQKIRLNLNVGDWVFGTGSKANNLNGKLIFAMNVTEKLNFQQYWDDPRFEYKKPIMNGSLIQMYGDNIYHREKENEAWVQENSHHSYENGVVNGHNLERDISGKYVLISDSFFYFGRSAIAIPECFVDHICIRRQGHRNVDHDIAQKFIKWLFKYFKKYN